VSRQDLESLLDRPSGQRVREYKYRFAQSVVFGLPVVGLELYGRALGGREADRWVMFIQLLLTTWVMYVGATGMLSEALLMLPRRWSADLPVCLVGVGMYLAGVVSFVGVITGGPAILGRAWFTGAVVLVGIWTGARWGWESARLRRDA
jgi:cation transport ATPase